MTKPRRLIGSSLLLIVSLVGFLSISNVRPAHAQNQYSVNSLTNSGFESGLYQWIANTYDDGNGGSTITVNNTFAVTGYYSARLDISANRTANNPRATSPMTSGHITLYQAPQVPQMPGVMPTFGSLTNRTDGLNLWLYIQPKFTGFSLIEIRIKAFDTTELDYFFVNPAIQITLTNMTFGGELNKPVKSIVLPMPPFNQWIHFQRNLGQDWTALMTNSNGTPGYTTRGFNLTETVNYVMLEAGLSSPPAGGWYGETAWIDNVALYVNSTTPAPPPPPSNYYASFNFQDQNGNSANNLVQWKLFNSTGQEVTGYMQNSATLTLEPYTVATYYPTITGQNPEPYLIDRHRITLNTTNTIQLAIFPQTTTPWNFIAFNTTITNMKIIKENATYLQFNAQGGTGPSLILIRVQSKALIVQRNLDDPSSIKWTYDSSLSILRVQAVGLGNFSIFLTPPVTIPSFAFQDITGNNVASGVTWKIFYPDGTPAQFVPGQLVQNGTYQFRAFYDGYLIFASDLVSTSNPVRLQLFPINSQQRTYIAFNSTVNTVTILENNSGRLQFRAIGQGPDLIIVNSPTKPLSIQLDGNTITSWTYNSTTSTIAIQASRLGTFTVTYSNTPPFPTLLVGAVIGAIAIATAGLLIWERTHSRRPNQPSTAEEKPETREEPKSKPKNPQKSKRGRS